MLLFPLRSGKPVQDHRLGVSFIVCPRHGRARRRHTQVNVLVRLGALLMKPLFPQRKWLLYALELAIEKNRSVPCLFGGPVRTRSHRRTPFRLTARRVVSSAQRGPDCNLRMVQRNESAFERCGARVAVDGRTSRRRPMIAAAPAFLSS